MNIAPRDFTVSRPSYYTVEHEVFLDGLELFDHAAYEAFRERAEASGLQLVVSRVSDGPLEVKAA